jgi:hypothetical protein
MIWRLICECVKGALIRARVEKKSNSVLLFATIELFLEGEVGMGSLPPVLESVRKN